MNEVLSAYIRYYNTSIARPYDADANIVALQQWLHLRNEAGDADNGELEYALKRFTVKLQDGEKCDSITLRSVA